MNPWYALLFMFILPLSEVVEIWKLLSWLLIEILELPSRSTGRLLDLSPRLTRMSFRQKQRDYNLSWMMLNRLLYLLWLSFMFLDLRRGLFRSCCRSVPSLIVVIMSFDDRRGCMYFLRVWLVFMWWGLGITLPAQTYKTTLPWSVITIVANRSSWTCLCL